MLATNNIIGPVQILFRIYMILYYMYNNIRAKTMHVLK